MCHCGSLVCYFFITVKREVISGGVLHEILLFLHNKIENMLTFTNAFLSPKPGVVASRPSQSLSSDCNRKSKARLCDYH